MTAFSWSPSALAGFETCPRRHWHLRVAKDVTEPESEALLWGARLHKAIEQIVCGKPQTSLPLAAVEQFVARLRAAMGGDDVAPLAEVEIALDREGRKVPWRSPRAWLRTKLDLVLHDRTGTVAAVVDWKTGKSADPDQLLVYATVLFDTDSQLERVKTAFVMVPEARPQGSRLWTRDEVNAERPALLARVAAMERAHSLGIDGHPPLPSGLCRKHCPVFSCPHNGRYTE